MKYFIPVIFLLAICACTQPHPVYDRSNKNKSLQDLSKIDKYSESDRNLIAFYIALDNKFECGIDKKSYDEILANAKILDSLGSGTSVQMIYFPKLMKYYMDTIIDVKITHLNELYGGQTGNLSAYITNNSNKTITSFEAHTVSIEQDYSDEILYLITADNTFLKPNTSDTINCLFFAQDKRVVELFHHKRNEITLPIKITFDDHSFVKRKHN